MAANWNPPHVPARKALREHTMAGCLAALFYTLTGVSHLALLFLGVVLTVGTLHFYFG